MKIIVVHASAGAGHSKAAEALYNYLREHRDNVKADIIDVLEKSNFFFRLSYRYGYSLLVRHTPILWSLSFRISHFRILRPFTRGLALFLNRLNTKKFMEFLIRENPDCVISTHFLASEISAFLKIRQKIKSKLVTVITDFGVHPFWISSGTDLYVVASDFTKQQLIDEGIAESMVRALGIPVDTKFLGEFNKGELMAKFNLSRNKFTILVVTGSFGTGPIEEIVDALSQEVQIMVVCANNKRLFRDLNRKNYPGVRVFGFIDNIQELMAVSDVIITKPGGLGISESLVMDLFPIFIAAIPGQETENIKVLAKYGLGIKATNVKSVKEAILDFRNHSEKLISIKERIRKLKKPFAVMDICDALC
jgi:processive 1,2-diacylglycerol beta-glucosyltransferase